MSSPIYTDMLQWQPIETAPGLSRVWVCGWQKPHGTTRGYWWWHEDCVAYGAAIEHPGAIYWAPIVLPEPLPAHNDVLEG